MPDEPTEFELNGVRLRVPEALLDPRIAQKLETGGYEAHEARAVQMRLRPGQRVLELGGGLGYVSALAARITGGANVVTVEANPALLPVIRDTWALNAVTGGTLIHGAVTGAAADKASDAPGHETLGFDPARAFWGGRIAGADTPGARAVRVPARPLPPLLDTHRPDVVIMDIEGAEARLFDAPWPGHVQAVMMELHPGRYPDSAIKRIVDCLSASGLTYDPGPSRGRILCLRRLRGG